MDSGEQICYGKVFTGFKGLVGQPSTTLTGTLVKKMRSFAHETTET